MLGNNLNFLDKMVSDMSLARKDHWIQATSGDDRKQFPNPGERPDTCSFGFIRTEKQPASADWDKLVCNC